MAGTFIWTKLNPLHPRMLCAKIGRNWLSGSGEEVFFNFINLFSSFRNYLPWKRAGPFFWTSSNAISSIKSSLGFCCWLVETVALDTAVRVFSRLMRCLVGKLCAFCIWFAMVQVCLEHYYLTLFAPRTDNWSFWFMSTNRHDVPRVYTVLVQVGNTRCPNTVVHIFFEQVSCYADLFH